jgi:ATPase subunit of ABC transporter with duplicated ATPase domains
MTSCNIDKITNNVESIGLDGINIIAGKNQLIVKGKMSLLTGRRYGICGRNGSGKTTLLNFIQSLIPNSMYIDQYISHEKWQDESIVDAILQSHVERHKLLQELSNDDFDSYQRALEDLHALDADKDESLVIKVLNGLGFSSEDMQKTYYSFSGGWKTRVSLARALFMKPHVLFLDEPTNHLDLDAIIWLENYLKSYKGILVFVSHNIDFLNTVSTDIYHIFNKSLKHYTGNYYRFQKQFDSDLQQMEKNYNLHQKKIKQVRAKGNKSEVERLMKQDIPRPEKPYRIQMQFETDTRAKSPYITLSNVSFGYSTEKPLIKNIDLALHENTRISLVGKNGCGKSTLFRLLLGELTPWEGSVTRNENVKVSYFNQHSIEQLPEDQTPVEYLTNKFGLDVQDIRKTLGLISLPGEYHNKQIKVLSGGQRMRIVFSEVIIEKPHIILLDEPTNHLDIETIECLIESLNKYTGAVLIISHDLFLIESTECLIHHLHDTKLTQLESIQQYIN